MSNQSDGALTGITVIELTHAIAGPHCGQILADHGAHVIKVEPPTGDFTRASRPIVRDDSVYFACHNRGKRSVTLDLKSPEDRESLDGLLARADVLLTNYSAAVPAKLGFGYEQVHARYPQLVFAHITGFGMSSNDRDVRAYDGIIQSMSGIPASTGTAETGPVLTSAFVADHVAAYHASLGILLALRDRERTGEGSFIDVSMLDAYASTSAHFLEASLSGQAPLPLGNQVATAFSNTFEAADGTVYLAPLGQQKWERFCTIIGREDWAAGLEYQQMLATIRDEAERVVSAWCQDRRRDDIVSVMQQNAIPCGPVLTSADYARRAVDSRSARQVTAPTGVTYWVPGPVSSAGLTSDPRQNQIPRLGQDNEVELGLDR